MNEFEYGSDFRPGEASESVQLGKFETVYEELFAEVIEDGVITAEERARLDQAADSLGLDRGQLRRLEHALQAAYEARSKVRVRELADAQVPRAAAAAQPRPALEPLEPATDQRTLALERRVRQLEARIAELELELEDARAQVAVDIDLSDVSAQTAPSADDLADLQRRVRHDPRDVDGLHALYRAYTRLSDDEQRLCIAQVLVFLRAANVDEKSFLDGKRAPGLIKPAAGVSRDGWRRLLFHPELEPLTGEIFAVVAPAVLLGRISALRREKALPKLDPAHRQDPAKPGLYAVRSFTWAGGILGIQVPPLYADPEWNGLVEMVPGVPPATRMGTGVLSGRSPQEMAFLAGQLLTLYREDFFLRSLIPSLATLEDMFLAALSIGNPGGLPLNAQAKARINPLASAIEPLLDSAAVDRLRGQFLRFVEEGGRTNLQRWAHAVDKTAARAGLLLAHDLDAARNVLQLEDPAHVDQRMDDLLEFVSSDRYGKLRKQLGLA